MKNNWIVPLIVVVGIVSVLIYFNYKRGQEAVPLSELFKDETQNVQKVEYEFVNAEKELTPVTIPTTAAIVPVAKQQTIQTPQVQTTAKPTGKAFTIQIASYKEKDKADKALEKIKTKYPEAYVSSRDLGDKGLWYRLYVGQFGKKEDADQMLTSVKIDYPQSFIITK